MSDQACLLDEALTSSRHTQVRRRTSCHSLQRSRQVCPGMPNTLILSMSAKWASLHKLDTRISLYVERFSSRSVLPPGHRLRQNKHSLPLLPHLPRPPVSHPPLHRRPLRCHIYWHHGPCRHLSMYPYPRWLGHHH